MPYQPAVHRTILVVDIEGFGSPHRTDPHLVAVRHGLYQVVRQAFSNARIPWANCDHEDRGDGVLVLIPPEVPKSLIAAALPPSLAAALHEHNTGRTAAELIRLRVALHAGEICYDDHGVAGAAVNLTFRLLEAHELKAVLAASPGVLALAASSWFFNEVVRHSPASNPATYCPIPVTVKETATICWVCLPDQPWPPATQRQEHLIDGLLTAQGDPRRGLPRQTGQRRRPKAAQWRTPRPVGVWEVYGDCATPETAQGVSGCGADANKWLFGAGTG
jgi:hypothetical protein